MWGALGIVTLPPFLVAGNGTLNKLAGIDFKQLTLGHKLNANQSGEVGRQEPRVGLPCPALLGRSRNLTSPGRPESLRPMSRGWAHEGGRFVLQHSRCWTWGQFPSAMGDEPCPAPSAVRG